LQGPRQATNLLLIATNSVNILSYRFYYTIALLTYTYLSHYNYHY